MKEGTFLSMVQQRDKTLEQVFYHCFKHGPVVSSLNLPPIVQDILFGLIDGYKDTLLAFGKYSVRLRQKLDYKNERLTKMNEDLKKDMIRQVAYDKFLKDKMENLETEMQRINVMIKGFYDNSLLGIRREDIKDTFSEVTASLEAISADLGQERVAIVTQSGEQEGQGGDPQAP